MRVVYDLCLGRGLAEWRAFDGADIADRFAEWYKDGPFDIELMIADAISEYQSGTSWRDAGGEVWRRRAEGSNAGNGSNKSRRLASEAPII